MWGFPGGAGGKEPICQCKRHERRGFDPWVRKIPWRRAWQPTPVFLPGKFQGQRSLVGYSLQGHKESDMTEVIQHACTPGKYKGQVWAGSLMTTISCELLSPLDRALDRQQIIIVNTFLKNFLAMQYVRSQFSDQGSTPYYPALEAQSLNPWTGITARHFLFSDIRPISYVTDDSSVQTFEFLFLALIQDFLQF